jgi:H+/Na+-translocating ferredoxin:NAD+ oxidoreductase subunit G
MNYFIKLGLVLLIITAIASGILAFINSITEPIIIENQKRAQVEARKDVLSKATTFVADSVNVEKKATVNNPLKKVAKSAGNKFYYFVGTDDDKNIIGYTFVASQYGYSSEIKTMVGVNNDFTLNKIKIIYQSETPGLGANCETQDYASKYELKTKKELKVDKDGGKIASLTGATITTRAITNSIRESLENLEKAILEKNTSNSEEGKS